MASSTAQTRTRPRRTNRVRYTYDSESEPDLSTPPPLRSTRPSRTSHHVRTYREDSDDTDNSTALSSSESSSEAEPLARPLRSLRIQQAISRRSEIPSNPTRKRKASSRVERHSKPFASFKRRKPDNSTNAKVVVFIPQRFLAIPPSGKIPPWQQLPYHILQSIMKYAAFPLYHEASRSTPSIHWLCEISTLCRSFHDACTAALLYAPPLYPSFRAHGLLALLKKDPQTTTMNYQNKIKRLDIEVKNLLVRKSGIDLAELLDYTPLLERLRLYHNHDDYQQKHIWAQPSAGKGQWAYPESLFDKLDQNNIRLKSFDWNGRFPNTTDVLQTIGQAHLRPCLSQLQEVSFLNLSVPEKASEDDIVMATSLLAASLDALPELQTLRFRNCNIVNDSIVSHLPPALHQIEFSNCPSLTSAILENWLTNKGSNVRTLRLVGNQLMSLGFSANLRTLCPRLQHLYVDLTYTDPTSYRDRDPLYDDLLPEGPPRWPTSLVHVEIENLRQLSADEAESFFNSLTSAAPELPFLRVLILKAILKEASWRDRAEMRKKWIPKLEHFFLNTSIPNDISKKPSQTVTNRQSTRIARHHGKKLTASDESGDSDLSGSQGSGADDTRQKPSRQGRCDIVQLMISDQRPAQDQFHENDFLDDEPSGDEEWTGRNEEASGYAW